MSIKHTRRAFVQSVALAAGTGVLARTSWATAAKEPPFKISLAEWSLHRTLFGGKLDNLDFPKAAKNDYGIGAVEYVNQFFKDKAKDQKYLAELKTRTADLDVRNVLIMIDDEGNLGDPNKDKQKKAIENHYPWVEAAKFLGCHSIRVNARSEGTFDEQLDRAADGLRRLAEFAAARQMGVIVENHGGLSSNGKWLAAVMKKVSLANCGTLPDFGNFGDYDRYLGVEELMPYAKGVSAKSNEFDANGNESQTDFRKMLKIVLAAGYHGYLGIEYEGGKLAEPEGIRATKKLLDQLLSELA